jgi:hypothetical protein
MRLGKWLAAQPYGTGSRLCERAGIGYATLMRLKGDQNVADYATAKRIVEAIRALAPRSKGKPTIADLCEPPSDTKSSQPKQRSRRKRDPQPTAAA